MQEPSDFGIADHGSIVLFLAYTPRVGAWFNEHTDAMRFGQAYIVEHRYAPDIYCLLKDAGFTD